MSAYLARWRVRRPRSGAQSINWQQRHIYFENEDYPGVKVLFQGYSMRYCMNSTSVSKFIRDPPNGIEEKRALCQQHEVLAEQFVFFFSHLSEENERQCAFCGEKFVSVATLFTHFQKDHWEEVKSPLVKSARMGV